jgi:AcrR family transcriptional regulator
MVRLARFSAPAFVDAAIGLIADGGPAAASMAAIARKVGAPTGSLYHRFESRAAVLATAWIEVHGSFIAAVAPYLRAGFGLDAALAIVTWARRDIRHGRFLLLNEAGTLFDDAPPPESLRSAIRAQEDELDAAFQGYLAIVASPADAAFAEAAARARFLVFDGPIALLRPHLLAGASLPPFLEVVLTEMHHAVSAAAGPRPAPAPSPAGPTLLGTA